MMFGSIGLCVKFPFYVYGFCTYKRHLTGGFGGDGEKQEMGLYNKILVFLWIFLAAGVMALMQLLEPFAGNVGINLGSRNIGMTK